MLKLLIEDDEGKQTVVPLIRDEITIGRKEGNTIRVASSSAAAAWLGMASPDSHWYYTTVFRLQSELHPDIRQLVCGTVFPSGFESRDITISEFETLAGNVMSLQIAVK